MNYLWKLGLTKMTMKQEEKEEEEEMDDYDDDQGWMIYLQLRVI